MMEQEQTPAQQTPADVTIETIAQIRSMLGCTTGEALQVYQQLRAEAQVEPKH